MLLFKEIRDLQRYLYGLHRAGYQIGFVPTMGALHEGHISLIQHSMQEADITVCSIFVNPTQFNNPSDLKHYPRTPEKDMDMLVQAGCHVLFMPEVEEIYPKNFDSNMHLNFGYLAKPMEGAHRPGHFEGVAMVVKRLLDIVRPDMLFMGQKDFQQLAIIREMLKILKMEVKLVSCPTVRESDGLAMSSRNVRLTPEQRALAPIIYKTLKEAFAEFNLLPVSQIESIAMNKLSVPGIQPEYFEIVDGYTLMPIRQTEDSGMVVACTAVILGEVRLIDNLIFKQPLT
jgi:pantoate--beta-alanine ligase